ncbi:unnamed protein product [Owenia fusiformis]|uniref:Chitin-binding type-2 domain-containing protein n=1 Tax=Owenia fusiformis TaxID=6347 RepID=A0A8S4NRL8_OWEFU|nr:unnamed protein product [Owenia fusiformis]
MCKNWTSVKIFIFFTLLIQETSSQRRKKAKNESGADVVDAALEKLKEYSDTGIEFLRNIACVESKYGTEKDTYRENYHGGIWQVDEARFTDTKDTTSHPELIESYEKIKELYDIDWETVKWKNLKDPFYSVLAARLVLQNQGESLPSEKDIEAQGEYWDKNYDTTENEETAFNFALRVKGCRRKERNGRKQKEEKTNTDENTGEEVPQGGDEGENDREVIIAGEETIIQDNTTKEETETKTPSGIDVVNTALEKLTQYADKGLEFLRNIACVESKYGTDKDTYRENYHGGIWQVNEATFNETKDTASRSKLKKNLEKIKNLYDVNWESATWKELRDPFYSALAARLFLQIQDEKLPSEKDINKQGEYWSQYYNPDDGTRTADEFVQRVEECTKKEEPTDKPTEKPDETPEDEDRGKESSQVGKPVQWIGCPSGPKVPEWERLVADPNSCDHFYHCNSNGLTWRKACPSIIRGSKLRLHWNDELKVCDWPSRAHCKVTKK